ncbi:winged helix-turn-helix domain-containing protein [Granulicella mallensis]|nr:winged helix-turn-helix domain-containing protein [Granulicella mallensis]
MRVRLQEIPFRMLLVLLEQPGQIVTREELRNRLWDEKTFVEFDNNLRVAAAKLREALRDDAASPQFIETIARRGYRFIGEASPIFDTPALAPSEPLAPVAPSLQIVPPSQIALDGTPPRRGRRRLLLALCGAALPLATALFYIWRQRQPLIHSHDSVAIGGFLNRSGNHNYDDVLSLPFRIKMEESPYLRLVSRDSFAHLLKNADASLAEEMQACRQSNAHALLTGELTSHGQGYELQIDAWRCSNGRRLGTESVKTDSQAGILDALGQASEKMRLRLGESEESLQKFSVPLVQATTSSVAALNAFRLGEEKHATGLYTESQTFYKLAIDFDPQFALAYLQLGRSYSNAGESSLSRIYAQKAFDLRERTTDREKLYISSAYYSFYTGEVHRAIEVYQLWMSLYPRDIVPVNNLAVEYNILGQPQKAAPYARKAIELDPSILLPYSVLAEADLRSGNYTELNRLCNDPAHANDSAVAFHVACYKSAFVQNNEAVMQHQTQFVQGAAQQSAMLNEIAAVSFYRGRQAEADRGFVTARQNAIANNLPEFAAEIIVEQAGLDADAGRPAQAAQLAEEALHYAPHNIEVEAGAALALARIGQIARAEAISRKATAESPLDTQLQFVELPSVNAAIAMQHNQPDEAVKALEPARPYDQVVVMGLSPAYYRGLAYLQGRHWQQASAEFRSVLDHRAASPNSPYILLSQLELGHALQLSGNSQEATAQFQQLEEVWKNADTDFPPIKLLHLYEHLHPAR